MKTPTVQLDIYAVNIYSFITRITFEPYINIYALPNF